MEKRKLLLMLIAFVCLGVGAQTVKQNGVVYKIKGTGAKITDYDPNATRIVIEGEIIYKGNAYTVEGFEGYVSFKDKTKIREMVFAKSCTEIPNYVANYIYTLRKVIIQGPVWKIRESAFANCKQLREINLPESLQEIESRAFSDCKALESIELPEHLEKLGTGVFMGAGLRSIVVPKSVREMGEGVFAFCPLTSATMLNTPRKIERSTFKCCKALNAFVVPNSVKDIAPSAFENCEALFSIVLPDNARYYTDKEAPAPYHTSDKGTFYGCLQLSNVICHNGTVPVNIKKYLPNACPFIDNGEKSEEPGFEKSLLAAADATSKGISLASTPKKTAMQSDVDINIPQSQQNNTDTYAVIIGNEQYKNVPPVSFAEHDANTFAEYCTKVLGLPSKNVSIYTNASYGELLKAVKNIKQVAQANKGKLNIIFYYSGHGVPSEDTKDAYLLPIDADGTMMEVCYPVSKLYADLSATNAERIMVFLDACFSGAQRDGGVLQASARGVAIKAKSTNPQKNMIVLSAATGDETAYPYKEKEHGMFTYYLLKKLQETAGKTTMGELMDYVKMEVLKSSITENKKSQTPTITVSPELKATWYNIPVR